MVLPWSTCVVSCVMACLLDGVLLADAASHVRDDRDVAQALERRGGHAQPLARAELPGAGAQRTSGHERPRRAGQHHYASCSATHRPISLAFLQKRAANPFAGVLCKGSRLLSPSKNSCGNRQRSLGDATASVRPALLPHAGVIHGGERRSTHVYIGLWSGLTSRVGRRATKINVAIAWCLPGHPCRAGASLGLRPLSSHVTIYHPRRATEE